MNRINKMTYAEREIHNSSITDRKILINRIIREFDKQLKAFQPGFKKGRGRFWVMQLNENYRFYISFIFPKYLYGDSRIEIAYHVESTNFEPVEQSYSVRQKTVTYPYRFHHQLFEFPHTPWCRLRVGYFYWKLLMQKKMLYYYTQDQADYSANVLIPYALNKIIKDYNQARKKYFI
jgi:hypothetical protein